MNSVVILSLQIVFRKRIHFAGFGDTLSFQHLLLTNSDNNSSFRCVVDLADVENVTSTEITVKFCKYDMPHTVENDEFIN